METSGTGIIGYQELLREAAARPEGIVEFLRNELPYAWRSAYIEMTPHPVNIVRWHYGTFEYLFDDYASLGTC